MLTTRCQLPARPPGDPVTPSLTSLWLSDKYKHPITPRETIAYKMKKEQQATQHAQRHLPIAQCVCRAADTCCPHTDHNVLPHRDMAAPRKGFAKLCLKGAAGTTPQQLREQLGVGEEYLVRGNGVLGSDEACAARVLYRCCTCRSGLKLGGFPRATSPVDLTFIPVQERHN